MFGQRDGTLHCEDIPLEAIAARHGTPVFVYSAAAIETAWRAFADALAGRDALVCYAVKANSNLGVLALLARLGAGFDIVSGGELARVLAAGGDPAKVVFSGVGKREAEMRLALEAGVYCFNVESDGELERLDAVARALGRRAPVALRVNPDVDPQTHPYISTGLRENKFGIPIEDAQRLFRRAAAMPGIEITGIDVHIGSQVTQLAPFVEALERLLEYTGVLEAAGVPIRHIDVGGGLGIRYGEETPPSPQDYMRAVLGALAGSPAKLVFEPGRALVGNAGVLLTRVEYLKPGAKKNFLVVDAAMNDLLRPSLYEAWHAVEPVRPAPDGATDMVWDLVGPVCETGDFLARDRRLAVRQGDLLAILSAGAYAMSMSSNYNTRPRAAEVMVHGGRTTLVRRRETVPELFAHESIPSW